MTVDGDLDILKIVQFVAGRLPKDQGVASPIHDPIGNGEALYAVLRATLPDAHFATLQLLIGDIRKLLSRPAALPQPPAPAEGWRPIETAPKGKKILVGFRNRCGLWRTVTACFYEDGELESEYTDSGFAVPGWYEESETQDELARLTDPLAGWLPLPAAPEARS